VFHPSSGIWLAGSVRFEKWLDWFRKIGHLAKNRWRDSQNPIQKKNHACSNVAEGKFQLVLSVQSYDVSGMVGHDS
jgi:hypothetical protein